MVNGNGGRQQENERHLVQGTWRQYRSTLHALRDYAKNGGWSPVTTRDPRHQYQLRCKSIQQHAAHDRTCQRKARI